MNIPIGTIFTLPDAFKVPKWAVVLKGQEVSKDKYPELYAAIRDTYGIAKKKENFVLPEFRDYQVTDRNNRVIMVAKPLEYARTP